MNLQLATARLGVLLTAEALEAGGHLLLYTSSPGSTEPGRVRPSLTSSPRQALFPPHLQLRGFQESAWAVGLNPRSPI